MDFLGVACLWALAILLVLAIGGARRAMPLLGGGRGLRGLARATGGRFEARPFDGCLWMIDYRASKGAFFLVELDREVVDGGEPGRVTEFVAMLGAANASGLRISVEGRGRGAVGLPPMGSRITFDDRFFDAFVQVVASDEAAARALLDGPMRHDLYALCTELSAMAPEVRLIRAAFAIRCNGAFGSNDEIARFVELARSLAEKVYAHFGAAGAGPSLEPVDPRGVELLGAGEPQETCCQICGEALAENLVACGRCGTLHHAECWTFNGACSVFACGGRVARPVAALPSSKPDGPDA